jgi:iron(II)-dependent oxidoreductase
MAPGEYTGDVSFYGVHDMLGNVYEWTSSEYTRYPGCKFNDDNYKLKLIAVKGAQFGIQGKVWYLAARSAFPRNSITAQGFRCVRDATPEEEEMYSEQVKGGTPVIQVWEKPAE